MSARPIVTISSATAKMIQSFAKERAITGRLELRIQLAGGAESGFAYDIYFDEPTLVDEVIECHGVSLLVDPQSAPYLAGSVVEWVEGNNGAGFQVQNPNEPAK